MHKKIISVIAGIALFSFSVLPVFGDVAKKEKSDSLPHTAVHGSIALTESLPTTLGESVAVSAENFLSVEAITHQADKNISPPQYRFSIEKKDKTIGDLSLVTPIIPKGAAVRKKNQVAVWFRPSLALAAEISPSSSFSGIDKNSIDRALIYLSSEQHEDGSFGKQDLYAMTYYAVAALGRWGKANTVQYTLGLEYLKKTIPKNNRERALKAHVLFELGEPYESLVGTIISAQNTDGGFGYDKGYDSDPLTTLEVFLLLNVNQTIAATYTNAWNGALYYFATHIGQDGNISFSYKGPPGIYIMNRYAQALDFLKGYTAEFNGNIYQIGDAVGAIPTALQQILFQENSSRRAISYALSSQTFELYGFSEQAVLARNALLSKQDVHGSFDNEVLSTVIAIDTLGGPDLVINAVQPVQQLTTGVPGELSVQAQNTGTRSITVGRLHFFIDAAYGNQYFDFKDSGIELKPGETLNLIWPIEYSQLFVGNTKVHFFADIPNDLQKSTNTFSSEIFVNANSQKMAAAPVYFVAFTTVYAGKPAIQYY